MGVSAENEGNLMVPRETQIEILHMLEKNERGVARFYSVCADRFTEHEGFWRQLSLEEDTHALMIGVVRSLVVEENVDLGHRPSWDAVNELANGVKRQLDNLNVHELTMEHALMFADTIERLFSEGEAFRVYDDDPPELANLLRHLFEDSRQHAQSVADRLSGIENTQRNIVKQDTPTED